MHPEHLDPEAESMWMRQSGIKGIRLHSHGHRTEGQKALGMMLEAYIIND